MTISPLHPGTATPRHAEPKKLKEAASQFEGFMLSEMLESAWASSGDETESSVAEMAQEQFAQALASSGGLGLAKLVLKQLSPVP